MCIKLQKGTFPAIAEDLLRRYVSDRFLKRLF